MRLHRRVSAGSGDATLVSSRRCKLKKVIIGNVTSSGYVKLYDSAVAPTAGAGTPVLSLWSGVVGGKSPIIFDFSKDDIVFHSGLGFTVVTGTADNDSTAVLANQLCVHIFYDDGP